MWIPNKDMGNGETYIITHCEDLNKARRPGEMTRTTSFKSLFRVQREAPVYLLLICFFFFSHVRMLTRIPLVLVKTIFKYVESSLKTYSPTLEMQIMVLTERKQGSIKK